MSVNKAILIGRLGNDPEISVIPGSNTTAAKISIATTEKWKDKNTQQQQEKATWHNIKSYGRLAEIMRDYLKKGSQVYIEGSNCVDKYSDKNGQEKYFYYIKASQMQMLDSKSDSQAAQPYTPQPSASPSAPPSAPEGFDDDIPF